MVDFVDISRVVAKMRMLASDHDNRPTIARDNGCLKALVGFLAHTQDSIVLDALTTVKFLSLHPDNNTVLSAHKELMATVDGLKTHADEDIAEVANEITENLANMHQSPKRAALGDLTNKTTPSRSRPTPKSASKSKLNARATTTLLSITGLHGDADKDRLERAIIGVKGVISVSIDRVELGDIKITQDNGTEKTLAVRAVILAKCTGESIIENLNRQNFNASAYKDSALTEKFDSPNTSPSRRHTDAENADSPKYLTPPELRAAGENELVPTEGGGGALANRLEEQKRRQQATGGWLKKVGRALWIV